MKNLTHIIYKYKDTTFNWGQLDCCIFTALVVEEYTEQELPLWRAVIDYKDYKGAMKALKELNCKSILDLPGVILNTSKKDIKEVKVGDPVYYINEDGIGILGICNGARAYFLQEGGGLTARNIDDCLYCWSIN